jgi:cell wall assembly regulator SMI1
MVMSDTPSIKAAWNAWLAALEAKGIAARSIVRPGASEEQISELEQAIGARLPQEARELYLLADGQEDIFKIDGLASNKVLAPLFGGYEFNSLEDIAGQWASWREIREQYTPAELDDNFNDSVEVRGRDPVHKLYTHESWIPFATDGGGNSLALDLDPTAGGTRGQIIVIGSDEDQRRVLAPCLSAFIAGLAAMLDVGRLTIEPREDDERPIVFFDVEPGLLQ